MFLAILLQIFNKKSSYAQLPARSRYLYAELAVVLKIYLDKIVYAS